MIKKTAVFIMITIFMIAFLPVMSMALMDLDADPTPVVSSGSFICKTWGGTTMDSFSVGGGSLAAASFSRTRGSVIYNLSGSCSEGDTLSLDISGSQWDMSKSMVGLEHNQINMNIRFLNSSGTDICEPLKYTSGESKAASLSGSISGTVPAGAAQVVVSGSFACTWSSAYTKSTETVGVHVTYSVGSDSVPVPTNTTATIKPTEKPTPTSTPSPTQSNSSDNWSWWGTRETTPTKPSTAGLENRIVRFADLHGEVNVKRYDEDDDCYVFCDLNTPLQHGDVIKVLPGSGAILSFSDMTSVVLKEDTVVVLDIANEKETLVGVLAGNIWVNFKSMVKDGSMEVEMAQAVAGIKGTIISTRVSDEGEEVYLFTSSATVTSKTTGKTINLEPGQKALVDESGEILVSDFDIEEEAVKLGIPMSELETDGYGKNTSWLIWIVFIIAFAVLAIIMMQLLRKNKMKTRADPSTTGKPASSYGQANPTSTPQSTYCPHCGNQIPDGQRFCQHCGKEI